jgi:hypothetical protein
MKKTKNKIQINIEKILKSNPSIDKEMFEIAQDQSNKLKSLGLKRKEYNLAMPFVRNYVADSN